MLQRIKTMDQETIEEIRKEFKKETGQNAILVINIDGNTKERQVTINIEYLKWLEKRYVPYFINELVAKKKIEDLNKK